MKTGAHILGIETSCDETAAAVVTDGRVVRSSIVHSQADDHAPWGGVVPEIAGRGHLEAIVPVASRALEEAAMDREDLAGIAVTLRPGLLGSLLVGATAAKALSWAWSLPLVGVHHIHAHAYAALMSLEEWEFPYITLIVSGGHTSLYRTTSPLSHALLGETRDDAAGEALDKAANLLGLSYPGGPSIEEAGKNGNPNACPFKLPLLEPDSLEFSFSGLKTALLYRVKGPGGKRNEPDLPDAPPLEDLCASYEHAIARTLAEKCLRACDQEGIPRILVGGGVARNRRLRELLGEMALARGIQAVFAAPEHCTDNAVMIAGLGHALFEVGETVDLRADVAAS